MEPSHVETTVGYKTRLGASFGYAWGQLIHDISKPWENVKSEIRAATYLGIDADTGKIAKVRDLSDISYILTRISQFPLDVIALYSGMPAMTTHSPKRGFVPKTTA